MTCRKRPVEWHGGVKHESGRISETVRTVLAAIVIAGLTLPQQEEVRRGKPYPAGRTQMKPIWDACVAAWTHHDQQGQRQQAELTPAAPEHVMAGADSDGDSSDAEGSEADDDEAADDSSESSDEEGNNDWATDDEDDAAPAKVARAAPAAAAAAAPAGCASACQHVAASDANAAAPSALARSVARMLPSQPSTSMGIHTAAIAGAPPPQSTYASASAAAAAEACTPKHAKPRTAEQKLRRNVIKAGKKYARRFLQSATVRDLPPMQRGYKLIKHAESLKQLKDILEAGFIDSSNKQRMFINVKHARLKDAKRRSNADVAQQGVSWAEVTAKMGNPTDRTVWRLLQAAFGMKRIKQLLRRPRDAAPVLVRASKICNDMHS